MPPHKAHWWQMHFLQVQQKTLSFSWWFSHLQRKTQMTRHKYIQQKEEAFNFKHIMNLNVVFLQYVYKVYQNKSMKIVRATGGEKNMWNASDAGQKQAMRKRQRRGTGIPIFPSSCCQNLLPFPRKNICGNPGIFCIIQTSLLLLHKYCRCTPWKFIMVMWLDQLFRCRFPLDIYRSSVCLNIMSRVT